MLIFDLSREPNLAGLRVASLGTCRARNPIAALGAPQGVQIRGSLDIPTHTAAEALQSVRFISGALSVPEIINPYIFATQDAPSTRELVQLTEGGVDACLLEVSDHKQFSFEGFRLQQNFVSTKLVQPHRGALLGWYRKVCRSGAADEAAVETALDELRRGGYRHDAEMARLLRGVTLRSLTLEEVTADVAAVAAAVARQMVVVGAFLVPGEHGAVMDARSALNAQLEVAAERAGALYFDVSALIAEYGRERSLDYGGANIYEFAEDFMPIVGAAYISRLQFATQSSSAPSAAPTPAPSKSNSKSCSVAVKDREAGARPPMLIDTWTMAPKLLAAADAAMINSIASDIALERVARLGGEAAGVTGFYKRRSEEKTLLQPSEIMCAHIVETQAHDIQQVFEIGCGLGLLSLLLSLRGFSAVAIERNRARLDTAEAIGAAVARAAPAMTTGPRWIHGEFPRVGRRRPWSKRRIALVTNLLGSAPRENQLRFIAGLRGFEAVLIDAQRFYERRSSGPEIDELLAMFAAQGFDAPRLAFDLGPDGRFYLINNPRPKAGWL